MTKDDIYADKEKSIADFNFGSDTAEVFDDMLNRSVPLYGELQRMIGEIADEFAKKREALENVLIPYRTVENEQLLQRHGFRYTDIFYKWYNFCGLVAVKQ